MNKGTSLENLLHLYSPKEVGLFPGRTNRDPEISCFVKNLKFYTKSPYIVLTDGKNTVRCDVSYGDTIIVDFFKGDLFREWVDILEKGMGSIMCDSMVKAKFTGYNAFEVELFNWIYKHHADPDYKFEFSL